MSSIGLKLSTTQELWMRLPCSPSRHAATSGQLNECVELECATAHVWICVFFKKTGIEQATQRMRGQKMTGGSALRRWW